MTTASSATPPVGAAPSQRPRRWLVLLPLVVFGALALLLGRGLSLNPREVPSPLIGKPVPAFALTALDDPSRTVTPAAFAGKPWVLNVWASWCAPCRDEHPMLVDFARRTGATVVGWNHKDDRRAATAWLRQLGDPYAVVLHDGDGRAGIDLGVYGVPETFVVDAAGVVRFKHVGPLTETVLKERIEPLLRGAGHATR